MRADHIGNTGQRILASSLFNVLYGGKIGKGWAGTVEIILNKSFG
jgi:hypothetical protein